MPSSVLNLISKILIVIAVLLSMNGCGWVFSDENANPDGRSNSEEILAARKFKSYSVGGITSGLGVGKTLVLVLDDASNLNQRTTTLSANGFFSVGQMRKGKNFRVSIKNQPSGQICVINDAEGTIDEDAGFMQINCQDLRYNLSGAIIGSRTELALINQTTGERLVLPLGIERFAFAQTLANGENYAVEIIPTNAGQTCVVSNSNGIASGNVTNLQISCADTVIPPPPTPQGLAVSYAVKSYRFSWLASPGAVYYELAQDPDGAGPVAETLLIGGLTTQNYTYLIDALLPQRLNAVYRVRACHSGGCSAYSDPLVPDITKAIGFFKANNSRANAQFGFFAMSLSADGSTLAVGSLEETSNAVGIDGNAMDSSAASAGAVYVYSKNNGVWAQQAYIKASNTQAKQYFGVSVSLSSDGNTLAVGASGEASKSMGVGGNQNDNSATDAGAVYIFARNSTAWSQKTYLKASNTRAGSGFGVHVSLSADASSLAVGAWTESSNARGVDGDQTNTSASNSGAVYLFTFSGGTWNQQAYIKPSNTQPELRFGQRVVLSGNGSTLAVGAIRESSNATGINGDQLNATSSEAGAVYVFTRNSGVWQQQAYVKASNTNSSHVGVGDRFGVAISLSADGNTMAIGAWGEDSGGKGVDAAQNTESSSDSGAVYVFTRSAGGWSQQSFIKASNARVGDRFGVRLALSADGNLLAVGAFAQDSSGVGIESDQASNGAADSGAVYLFNREQGRWSQGAYIKSSGSRANDNFGHGIAMSADGKTLAVGAPGQSSNATGIGAEQTDASAPFAGAVYLF
jgi:hypothetical protein